MGLIIRVMPNCGPLSRVDVMLIRPVNPSEYSAVGQLILDAYNGLPGRIPEPDYDLELLDVERRVNHGVAVMVAVGDDDELLGAVSYVGDPENPYMESDVPGAATFRHLAVAESAQAHGIGRMLVEWCVTEAVASGRQRIVIHSGEWMLGAHRLYERLGFVRGDHVREFEAKGSGLLVRLFEYAKEL